jgi:hypothetical protein
MLKSDIKFDIEVFGTCFHFQVQQPVQYTYLYQCVAAFIEAWNREGAYETSTTVMSLR